MIVDTSALLAYFDRNEPRHAEVARVIDESDEQLVVSPYVIAELDYLVLSRHGGEAELAILRELYSGAWELANMPVERLEAARDVVARFADQAIGVADAANVVLADAYRTRRVATLDRRHFSILRLADGAAVEMLPS